MKKNEEKLKKNLADLRKSVQNLSESLEIKNPDELVQDAIIKRFELAYELAWKTIKAYLAFQGIICSSPRECFKQAKIHGMVDDEQAWLSMIETRNILVHTYSAEKSRMMIQKIRKSHEPILVRMLHYFDQSS